jgi:hypothetical protein
MNDLDQFAEFESIMCRLYEQLEPADQDALLDVLDFGPAPVDPAEPTPAQVAAVIADMERQF